MLILVSLCRSRGILQVEAENGFNIKIESQE
jgi:hypothetical protein